PQSIVAAKLPALKKRFANVATGLVNWMSSVAVTGIGVSLIVGDAIVALLLICAVDPPTSETLKVVPPMTVDVELPVLVTLIVTLKAPVVEYVCEPTTLKRVPGPPGWVMTVARSSGEPSPQLIVALKLLICPRGSVSSNDPAITFVRGTFTVP